MQFLLLLLLLCSLNIQAEISMKKPEVWLEGKRYYLSTDLDIELNDTLIDALDHGVPLVFELKITVEEQGLFGKTLYQQKRGFRLSYRALSSYYQLDLTDTGRDVSFATKDALIRYLEKLQKIPLFSQSTLRLDKNHRLILEFYLDRNRLPLPLRTTAWLSSEWQLTSGKHRWALH